MTHYTRGRQSHEGWQCNWERIPSSPSSSSNRTAITGLGVRSCQSSQFQVRIVHYNQSCDFSIRNAQSHVNSAKYITCENLPFHDSNH